jgi:hypothetical protein
MFKADGVIGGTVGKVGGPFAKDGIVGLVFLSSIPVLIAFLLQESSPGYIRSYCRVT